MRWIVAAGALCAAAFMACGAQASNLVVNGDFSGGNSGFSSGYAYSPGNGYPPMVYDVTTNPHNIHGSWASFGDHTTGTGNMLVVNGGLDGTTSFWGEAPSVAKNTNYVFTVWVASSYPQSPATIALDINGAQVGSTFTASSTTGEWDKFTVDWNSGAATSAQLSLIDTNTAFSGNDFVIDDVSFGASGVPEPTTWAMALVGVGLMGATLRRQRPAFAKA